MAKEKENVCRKEVAFMKKRLLAVLLAMTMTAACLTACGESSSTADTEKTESSSSQVESNTDSESKTESTADISPESTADSKAENSSTTTSDAKDSSKAAQNNSGKYTYTVYGDIQLTMDVNIDDYIFTNNSGKKVFRFLELALDLGWWPGTGGGLLIDPSTYGKTYKGWGDTYHVKPQEFFWKTDSGYTHIAFDYMDDKEPKFSNAQLGYLSISSVIPNVDVKNVCSMHISKHYDNIEYVATNYVNISASRDDIIIYAYILSTVRKNPDKDPFAGTGLERYGSKDYRLP